MYGDGKYVHMYMWMLCMHVCVCACYGECVDFFTAATCAFKSVFLISHPCCFLPLSAAY